MSHGRVEYGGYARQPSSGRLVGLSGDIEEELNTWYNTQRVSERLVMPGFQGAAHYVSLEGTPTSVALYELNNARVLDTPPYKRQRIW
jgi:hypothetical protein